jgi:spore germination protein YaaH
VKTKTTMMITFLFASSCARPDGHSERAQAVAAPPHQRCGWIGAGESWGVDAFIANAAFFDAIHPYWYNLGTDSMSVLPGVDVDDAALLGAAAKHGTQVWPMVSGGESAAVMVNMFSDNNRRAAHVKNLVSVAVSHGYAGLDLDYEHMWDAADRPGFSQFILDFSTAMHAAGKKASIAIPALYSPAGAWDYNVLSGYLDALHVMGYDYHYLGASHVGPVAPLGWIDAVAIYAQSTTRASRFILGVPNYGVTTGSFCEGTECPAWCTSPYTSTSNEMASCPFNVDTHFTGGRAPNCPTANGLLYFDDVASMQEKISHAKSHGLGGVTYWTVGKELPGFFDMVTSYYPPSTTCTSNCGGG